MLLKKELDNWVKDKARYITRYYLIKNNAEKRNIGLYYKFEKDDERIEHKENVGVDLKYKLSKEDIYNFLDYCNDKFHKLIADHIEENWEQEIFTYNPNHLDDFEIAYSSPLMVKTQKGINAGGKVIITDGKRIGYQILSKVGEIDLEEKRGNIKMIGWSHK